MTADLTATYDPLIRKAMADHLLERLKPIDFFTPEWHAWADEWREEVPLTLEQVRENAAWRERVKQARELLAQARADYDASLTGIGEQFDVRVTWGGDEDGEPDVDDYTPPHTTTYRTKDGAPPEPQKWRTVKFVWGNVPDGKATDRREAGHE